MPVKTKEQELKEIEDSLKETYKFAPQRKAVAAKLYRKRLEERKGNEGD